ncbi:MAG: Asp23/Gls24 family envelope stress response protein [Clostridia bacterium]|nr:Asp23/Gls24 family envelope stress response protein [Clostridia bacterium]
MITYETKYGKVYVSNVFFAKLIGHAVTSCYGVAGMVPMGGQKIRNLFARGKMIDKGIVVSGSIDSISVDLHIIVTYGININAIANSIDHNVRYTVKEATGIDVKKVSVHVDGMKAD